MKESYFPSREEVIKSEDNLTEEQKSQTAERLRVFEKESIKAYTEFISHRNPDKERIRRVELSGLMHDSSDRYDVLSGMIGRHSQQFLFNDGSLYVEYTDWSSHTRKRYYFDRMQAEHFLVLEDKLDALKEDGSNDDTRQVLEQELNNLYMIGREQKLPDNLIGVDYLVNTPEIIQLRNDLEKIYSSTSDTGTEWREKAGEINEQILGKVRLERQKAFEEVKSAYAFTASGRTIEVFGDKAVFDFGSSGSNEFADEAVGNLKGRLSSIHLVDVDSPFVAGRTWKNPVLLGPEELSETRYVEAEGDPADPKSLVAKKKRN